MDDALPQIPLYYYEIFYLKRSDFWGADFSLLSVIFTTCNFTFISKREILAYVVNFLSLLLREEQGEDDIRKEKQNNALFYCFKHFGDIW